MAEYTYVCESCEHNFSVYKSIKQYRKTKIEKCPECGSESHRKFNEIHEVSAFAADTKRPSYEFETNLKRQLEYESDNNAKYGNNIMTL